MNSRTFTLAMVIVAASFTLFWFVDFLPHVIADGDIMLVLESGFVNPYAAGYSIDLITCWLVLIVWVIYEQRVLQVKYGWVCIALGLVPGVAVGFASYLMLRQFQKSQVSSKTSN